MRTKIIIMIMCLSHFMTGCQDNGMPPATITQTEVHLPATFKIPKSLRPAVFTRKMDYLVWLPAGYEDDPAKKWPVILYLHGAGAEREGMRTQLSMGLPHVLSRNEQPENFPFIVISPRIFSEYTWSAGNMHEILAALLDEVAVSYQVDSARIYLTGYSMGGYGAWFVAQKHPNRFAAMASVSGSGEQGMLSDRAQFCQLSRIPIWAIHGERDRISEVKLSKYYVDALSECADSQVKWTRYPGLGHAETAERAYRDPALYRWFLAHSK